MIKKEDIRKVIQRLHALKAKKRKNAKTSKYKGVHFKSGGKLRKRWIAKTYFYGKAIRIGSFRTEQEANMAYKEYYKKGIKV
jgi:hypothetical protein